MPGMSGRSEQSRKIKDNRLPPRGEAIQVRCGRTRCLAFRDWDGTWRNFLSREELKGEVELLTPSNGKSANGNQPDLFA